MTWWNRPGFEVYDGIICDGSIRSGKTVAMTVGFIMWAMTRFDGCNFAICGKTIEMPAPQCDKQSARLAGGRFLFQGAPH